MLEVRGLTHSFGGLRAVDGVDFEVHRGEVVGLIGPNGAGKTTVFNLISGAIRARQGSIHFGGEEITGLRPDQISRRGLARTFQTTKLFTDMSAFENVRLALIYGNPERRFRSEEAEREVNRLMASMGILADRNKAIREMSLASRRYLEITRAIATNAQMLLLDEAMAGLTPAELEQSKRLVSRLRDQGITILMIEHVMEAVMEVCDRIIVLHFGKKVAQGSPVEVATNSTVRNIYLGNSLLTIHKLNAGYGPIKALWDVSLSAAEAEIVAVLGANGAGKSTLVKCVVGLLDPISGMIKLGGRRIEGSRPHRISELGIAYAPEGGGVFRDMNVRENLEMGAYHQRAWERREKTLDRVFRLFPRLEEREHALARHLSGGERQMLVIGRALMSLPTLCVFDEPSIGMSPLLVEQSFHVISQLRDEGITILLIEQNVRKTLEIADRAYVLQNGRVVMEGAASALQSDLVDKAYLGL